MAIKLYKSQINISQQPSTVETAKLNPNFGQEVFQGQQSLLKVATAIEDAHRKVQDENDLIKAQTDYTDGFDDNDGLYEIVRKNQESNNIEESINNYNTETENWQNVIGNNITNKRVRKAFNNWALQTNSQYGLEVSQTVRKNNRAMLQENIALDTNRNINMYNTGNQAQKLTATNNIFGNEELGIKGMYDRLDDVYETPIGTSKEQYNLKLKTELDTSNGNYLVENNPDLFLAKIKEGEFLNLSSDNLLKFTETAKKNSTNQKISYILDSYIPINPDMSADDASLAYATSLDGSFIKKDGTVDNQVKSVYDNLDETQKTVFKQKLTTRFNQLQSDIAWQQNQNDYKETKANEAYYVDASAKILTGEFGIKEIDQIPWYGKQGEDLRNSLKAIVVKRYTGTVPNDNGLDMYDKLYQLVRNGTVNSITTPITLPGETKAISILDRVGSDGIGMNQSDQLYTYMATRNNKSERDNQDKFQDFLKANQATIKGVLKSLDKFNAFSDIRFFDFSLVMQQQFRSGLSQGKTAIQLLNSESPDYILTPDIVAKYSRSLREQSLEVNRSLGLNEANTETTINVLPRQPGESIEDYLIRTSNN